MFFKLFLLISYVYSLSDSSRPLLLWSQSDLIKEDYDDSILPVEHLLAAHVPQEVLTFGFIFDQLDFVSIQNLKEKIDTQYKTVFFPFATGGFQISASRSGLRADNWEAFQDSDKSAQFVVFQPKTEKELHALFQKCQAYESEDNNRKVAYFVTAEAPTENPTPVSAYQGKMFVSEYTLTADNTTNTVYTGPVSVTPFTFQALIIVWIVFIAGYIGNCCLSEIQVPITYLSKELPIRKEY